MCVHGIAAPRIPQMIAPAMLGRERTRSSVSRCASAIAMSIGYIRAVCAKTTASGLNAQIAAAASAVLSSNISQPSANTSTRLISEKTTDIERSEISLSPKMRE